MKNWIVLIFISFFTYGQSQGYSEAVRQANSNPAYPGNAVFASSFGSFAGADDSVAYYAALESANSFIVMDNPGGNPVTWHIVPKRTNLQNKTIVFEAGITLTHVPGSLTGPGNITSIINPFLSNNVEIYGYGAELLINKSETQGEANHTINIEGCDDIAIKGFNLSAIGQGQQGDAIAVTGNTVRRHSTNIVLEDMTADGFGRQGLSIISVDNLLVEHLDLRNTNSLYPSAGIDIEPNNYLNLVKDITINNTTMEGNRANGLLLALGYVNSAETKPDGSVEQPGVRDISITINDCLIKNNVLDNGTVDEKGNIFAYEDAELSIHRVKWKAPTGFIEFNRTKFVTNKDNAIHISKRGSPNYTLTFNDCEVELTGAAKEPIWFRNGSWNSHSLGTVTFNNLYIVSENPVDLMNINVGGSMFVEDVTGNAIVSSNVTNTINYSGSANQSLTDNVNITFDSGTPPIDPPLSGTLDITTKKKLMSGKVVRKRGN